MSLIDEEHIVVFVGLPDSVYIRVSSETDVPVPILVGFDRICQLYSCLGSQWNPKPTLSVSSKPSILITYLLGFTGGANKG